VSISSPFYVQIFRTNIGHYEEVHGEKMFTWRKFEKLFETDSHVKSHHKNDHNSNDTECGKHPKLSASLNTNIKITDSPKIASSVQCQLCDKSFADLYNCKRHVQKVHGERKFICLTCQKSFQSSYHLRRHQQTVHNKITIALPSGPVISCPSCKKSFQNYLGLERHQKRNHSPKGLIAPCQICDKLFTDLKNCKRHVQKVHGVRKFICPTCQKSFQSSYHLRRHQQTVHSLLCVPS